MAFIRELIVSNATIPSESESTNLSFELQAEAEVAHIIVNKNTYIGVIGRDRITWEFEPISIFRSEFQGDGQHELIVTANVYSNTMQDTDTQRVSINVTILPIITEPTDYPEYIQNIL